MSKYTKFTCMKKLLCIVALFLAITKYNTAKAQNKTTLSFASVLQSNMVVQQNKPFKVWGHAPAGDTITISADWIRSSIKVVADNANAFLGIIGIPVAKKGDFAKHQLVISDGKTSATLTNLLIGDTWICSGQSNMQFGMHETIDSATEIPAANYPNIRLFNGTLNFSNEPIDSIGGTWVECSPETVKKFTAVGYHFGRELYQTLNIPIGLVFTGIGASAAQAFVPRDVLAADHLLDSVYLEPYLRSDKSKEPMNGGFSFEKVTRPFLLYNALIHPFTKLSIKGFTWYQGESNRTERESYTRLTQAMIQSWRKNFGQGDLPFYYVQVAPFWYDQPDSTLADYAFFREAQENISKLNNTAMVVTMDVGEARNLHPKNKKPIGIRLAKTALHKEYGMLDVSYQGPHYDYVVFDKKKATIHFKLETVASGLATNDGNDPKYFLIAGKDKIFYAATAKIDGNAIVISSSKVKEPIAVRYAFTNFAVTNLQNGNGFPAVPFRTDDWQEIKVDKK